MLPALSGDEREGSETFYIVASFGVVLKDKSKRLGAGTQLELNFFYSIIFKIIK